MLVDFWVSAVRDGYIRRRHPQTGEVDYEKVAVRDMIAIATVLADRGWGKAPQVVVIEDDEPESQPEEPFDWEEFDRHFDELKEQNRRRKEELGSDE